MSSFPPIRIMYKNWKGVLRERHIQPLKFWFGSTLWHPSRQYLLQAIDLEDTQTKDFAMSGFGEWPDHANNIMAIGACDGDSGEGSTAPGTSVQSDLSKV